LTEEQREELTKELCRQFDERFLHGGVSQATKRQVSNLFSRAVDGEDVSVSMRSVATVTGLNEEAQGKLLKLFNFAVQHRRLSEQARKAKSTTTIKTVTETKVDPFVRMMCAYEDAIRPWWA